mmetsp:Transcript_28996/g.42620  ORF Transcript_28996/g.42620 Transcript_28996/m.42620 type:complete len:130 (+) Transcript_28996:1-390(+)
MKVDEARAKKCLPFNYMGDEAGMVVLHKEPASAAFPGLVSVFGSTWPKVQEMIEKFLKESDSIARLAESVPGVMDKLEQFFAKCFLKEDDSKEGMMRVLKEPAVPTDDDEFMSSFFGDMLIAMREAESE